MNTKIKIAIKIALCATLPFLLTRYLPPEYQKLLLCLTSIALGSWVIGLIVMGLCKISEKLYNKIVKPAGVKKYGFKKNFYSLAKYLIRFVAVYALFVYSIFTLVSINVT